MRVKNEAPYIKRAIQSLLPLRGEIIVLDDGSTDDTPKIIRSFRSVHYHRQDDVPMDEGRDRTFLQKEALKMGAEWIFTLDGDEELAENAPERMLDAIKHAPEDVNAFHMFLVIMWGENEFFGGRHIWSMDRMFRTSALSDKAYEYRSNFDNNLHCGCVPRPYKYDGKDVPGLINYKRTRLNAFIKYWGYESEALCQKKLRFYEEHDPVNFPNVSQTVLGRLKDSRMKYRPDLDARELGKPRTVTYGR